MAAIGGHQSTKSETVEWLTPPEVVKALGLFDLDPCSPITRPWDTAAKHYTETDDGLLQAWFGRVWLNPPYGTETWKWLNKLALHGNGIALIFARTETEGFHRFGWDAADGMLFFKGRLTFRKLNGDPGPGNAGAPSVLIAYGENNAEALRTANLPGKFVDLME